MYDTILYYHGIMHEISLIWFRFPSRYNVRTRCSVNPLAPRQTSDSYLKQYFCNNCTIIVLPDYPLPSIERQRPRLGTPLSTSNTQSIFPKITSHFIPVYILNEAFRDLQSLENTDNFFSKREKERRRSNVISYPPFVRMFRDDSFWDIQWSSNSRIVVFFLLTHRFPCDIDKYRQRL